MKKIIVSMRVKATYSENGGMSCSLYTLFIAPVYGHIITISLRLAYKAYVRWVRLSLVLHLELYEAVQLFPVAVICQFVVHSIDCVEPITISISPDPAICTGGKRAASTGEGKLENGVSRVSEKKLAALVDGAEQCRALGGTTQYM
jgi:hypothetical protein